MTDCLLPLLERVQTEDGPVLLAGAGAQADELRSSAHRHECGQLFGSLRGLLSVGVEDGVWLVPAIHAVWLPPGVMHSGRAHGAFYGWSVYVAARACADLPGKPCTLPLSGLLREAVLRAASWPAGSGPLTPAQAHLAAVILDEVRHAPVAAFGLPLPQDPRLLRIARALIAAPADDRSLDDWAAWGAVSARTLSRRFVAETGFHFSAWRQRVRMLRALEALASGTPVTAVALDLGYATASAFISVFKRSFGQTPAAYRAQL